VQNTRVHASNEDFAASIRAALDMAEDPRTVLLYVHGYNTTFASAAIRAAQIGFDLKVEGVTAFFSWPSHGRVRAYLPDLREADASRNEFQRFVHLLVDDTETLAINLIVHSMGNKLVIESLSSLKASLQQRGVKLGAVILAAPDVDVDLFRNLAATYPSIAAKTTMYVSRSDHALSQSGRLWSGQRAGFIPPITVCPSIDTIEVTPIDISLMGHGYYAAAGPVLHDIKAILDGHLDPDKRIRLRPVSMPPVKYWRFQA
jgi:esterase/lipase superfamily enzyme